LDYLSADGWLVMEWVVEEYTLEVRNPEDWAVDS
jgi:hypothetical protein